jgi:hypothetical protein
MTPPAEVFVFPCDGHAGDLRELRAARDSAGWVPECQMSFIAHGAAPPWCWCRLARTERATVVNNVILTVTYQGQLVVSIESTVAIV